jgi:hypothetical protein
MSFEPKSEKHCFMRDLLVELGVDDPERDDFYSTGSTVQAPAISAALEAVRDFKSSVRDFADRLKAHAK